MTRLLKKSAAAVLISSLVAIAFLLTGCELARNYTHLDRSGNMEVQDYRDTLASHLPAQQAAANAKQADNIPGLQPYVAQPSGTLKSMPLVSVSVNQTVPLRDVLFELARQAHYNIELDPRIKGAIIFTTQDTPLDLVVQQIAEIAGLSYEFNGNTVRVQLDNPYHAIYKLDYLSYVRTNSSSIQNNVSLAAGGGGGANAGSQFQAASQSEANFWGELETNMHQILDAPVAARYMKTDADPEITVVAANPAPVAPVVTKGTDGKTSVQVQPPQATLQVSSLPPATPGGAASTPAATPSTFSLNKQAGIISVYATGRQHEQIGEYLKQLRRSVTAQVLIEAKVMEVNLSDEFASGVDWGAVARLVDRNINVNAANFPIPALTPPAAGAFTIAKLSADISPNASFNPNSSATTESAVVSAVSRFGTVKALASPRLTVLNNQSAVLNVAINSVYFSVVATVTPGTTTTVGTTNITSSAHSVPEGVLINVQPSIDLDRRTISMAVRPTVTRIVDTVNDPGVELLNIPGVHSPVPEVNVQEMDSVVNMNSGEAVLMGGLMQDRTQAQQTGVPVLSEVPVVGALFRSQGDNISKTELIIFLRATIVDGGNASIDDADQDIYKKFSDDRHPFKM